MALLEVKNLSISFGGLKAVDNFHINIEKGQLYGLIGPNGAGKTTIFNLLTGVYKPNAGSIVLDDVNITGKSTIEINQAGNGMQSGGLSCTIGTDQRYNVSLVYIKGDSL